MKTRPLFITVLSTFLVTAMEAAVPNVDINVPLKGPAAMEIGILKVTVNIASDAPVTFRVEHSGGPAVLANVSTSSLSPGQTDNCFSAGDGCVFIYPTGVGSQVDTILLAPPPAAPAGDPQRRKYTFLINLNANYDQPGFCTSTMAAAEQWIIRSIAGPLIESVCVQSYDRQTGAVGTCGLQFRIVPADPLSPSAQIATVVGQAANLQGCRLGLDCVLVLDRSGSMTSPVAGGSPTPKIDRLRSSVTNFVGVWDTMRTNEAAMSASPQITGSPNDNVGVVFFDSTAKWLKELDAASTTAINALSPFPTVKTDITTRVPLIPTAGATSIGGGLLKAATALGAGTNRKVILLMSDGMQNTPPMAGIISGAVHATPGGALPNQPPLQIYSLTVGSGSMVDPSINQSIATATNGFYMNTETDAGILPTLFLQLLQNFVRFSTYETLRLAADRVSFGAPWTTTVPVTSTTQSIIFNLTWTAGPALRLVVQPPNGAPQIIENTQTQPGVITLSRTLPLDNGLSQMGDWIVRVEQTTGSTAGVAPVPFNIIVFGDDGGLSSDLAPVAAEYRPGDRIVVRASVREMVQKITTLGTTPQDRMLVRLLRPGQSIGDLLSDSTASSTPPESSDPLTPAEAKLLNMIAKDPGLIAPVEDQLTLRDDGNSTSGDAVAGDGIYSASFPAQLEGHYNFLFGVEGGTKQIGRFTRQQLRTVHVKPSPDNANTTFSSNVVDNVLIVTMTPRTATNHRVGPGWGPYFWFVPHGGNAVRATDRLDGTYTASIPFTGTVPPQVDVHYIDDAVKIPESVTDAGQLPVPLGPGNVLVSPLPGAPSASGRWRFFIDAGLNSPDGGLDGSFSINAGIERMLTNNWSIEGILGYHTFDGPFVDPDVWQLSANAKYFFGTGPLRPFLNGGVGVYRVDPPDDTEFGFNAGGGLLYELSSKWAVEGVYNYHTTDPLDWSTLQLGLRWHF